MAALKSTLENLDELADTMHDLYTEKDGKFILNVEGVQDHPEVLALKNALDRQKANNRKITDDMTKLKDRLAKIPEDFDPEAYQTLLVELEQMKADPDNKPTDKERQEAITRGKMLEQKISTLERTHAEVVKKKDEEIKKRDTTISGLLIDDGLTKALLDAGVGKEYMRAAKALLKQDVKVIEEDGVYKAIVETDTGELDVGRYVTDWVASDEGKVFIPPAKGGDAGGSNKPSRPGSTEKNPFAKDSYNMTEQGKLIREDRVKAEKLAKAAGVKLPSAA